MFVIPFAVAFAIGISILVSWIGWGGLLNACLIRDPKLDWGQRATWGLSLLLVLGGVFEALCVISRQLVLAILLVGVLLSLIQSIHSSHWTRFSLKQTRTMIYRHKVVSAVALLVLAVFALRLVESVHSQDLNWHDDFHGYLVFPHQMLQTGCTGYSPFHHRRLASAFGGKSFLDTFSLSLGSIYNFHVIDAGLGLVLTAGVLLGRLRKYGVGPGTTVCIMAVMVLLPPPRVNTTALMLGTALLLSLFQTLDSTWLWRHRPAMGAGIIALLAAGLCSLKNNFLPPTALILVASYLIYLHGSGSWRRALVEGAACAFLLLIFISPWMLSLHRSSGTLFYPILGKGYDASQYGPVLSPEVLPNPLLLLRVAATQPLFLALVATGVVVLSSRNRSWFARRGALFSIAVASPLAAICIALATTGFGRNLSWATHRMCFSTLIAAFLALLSVAAELAAVGKVSGPASGDARIEGDGSRFGMWRKVGLVVICILVCGKYHWQIRDMFGKSIVSIKQSFEHPKPAGNSTIRALQASIPAGEPMLAYLDVPFWLDFQRNPIYVVDHPAMVSPPPGMPSFKGAHALDQYLREQGIRYVLFSYKNEANYSYEHFHGRLKATQHPMRRAYTARAFDFNDSLQQLGLTRRRIYDNGMAFALDLEDRVEPSQPATK